MEEEEDPSLPIEILTTEILPKLPARSLLRFKTVCKSFETLISSPQFIHLHLHHSSLSSSPSNHHLLILLSTSHISISHLSLSSPATHLRLPSGPGGARLASDACHGLVLVLPAPGTLVLFNPATGFYREVGDESCAGNFGLGFDPVSKDYKIVSLKERYEREDGGYGGEEIKRVVRVYSVREDQWRVVQRRPSNDIITPFQPGTVVDNHLVHWKCWHPSNNEHRIVCFDLRNNQWSEDVPLPDYGESDSGGMHFADILFQTYRNKQNDLIHLGVLDGCLCLLIEKNKLSGVDVWVMEEYGVKESWVKLVTILNKEIGRQLKLCPFAYGKGSKREILIRADDQSRFIWYNIRDKTWRWAEMQGGTQYLGYAACVCNGSLVSIPRGNRLLIGPQQLQG